jgi:DNA-binding GntR family transcriptional regulator
MSNLGGDDETLSQSEIAYRALRRLVATGQCQPGSLLSEQLLADQAKVGRSPMREAISRLVHEGLLVRLPRRGVMVKALSVDEIRDLYEVRECLEVLAVRAAVTHMDDSTIAELRANLDEARAMVAAGCAWREYVPVDREFHAGIWSATQNARAVTILSQLADAAVLDRTQYIPANAAEQILVSVQEHTAILDAIERRDGQAAEDRMSHHTRDFQRSLIKRVSESSRLLMTAPVTPS